MKDLTIVTAVNQKYLSKLQKNLPTWLECQALHLPLIIFYNDVQVKPIEDLAEAWFSRTNQKVNVVQWAHPQSGGNVRERMLSAFVFGVTEKVKTDYWIKLDCDTECVDPSFDFSKISDYHKYSLLSHKWGYTKMKGDPDTSTHWLNRLDDWYCSRYKSLPLFPQLDPEKDCRYSHERVCTFVSIEKSNHTKDIANLCSEKKLPIPSQDTTSWYLAYRQSPSSISRINFKRWFRP